MTKREELAIYETRVRLLNRSGCRCEVCGKPVFLETSQIAHRIPKTKRNLKIYGKGVIHHEINLAVVCSLRCNSAVLRNIATNPVECGRIISRIKEALG
jgi:hypothetical protein